MDFDLIWAFTLRNLSLTFRNLDRILGIFYWPLLNIVVWGITSLWVEKSGQFNNFLLVFVTVLVFWQITLRSGVDVAKNLLDEIINKNLINIFITPLDINEWIVSAIFTSSLNITILISFSGLMVWLIYSLNIFATGLYSILFIISLIISGWSIGFILCGLIIRLGKNGADLLFTLGWLIAPFCAVYAPLDVLPKFLQSVAVYFPMTYIFENIRSLLISGTFSVNYILKNIGLNFLYFTLSLLFFKCMFAKSKIRGLASLD